MEQSSELAQIREWKREGDGWVCRAKNWQVIVNGSESLESSDEGPELPEIRRVRPDVRCRTEINVEGRQSSEAFMFAFATAQRIAFKLSGAIYDPQQDILSLPLSEGLFSFPDFSAPRKANP
jgi:hypothetical protein